MRKEVLLSGLLIWFAMEAQVALPDQTQIPALVTAKAVPIISTSLQSFLTSTPVIGEVKVWVYFTDKGVFDRKDYLKAIQERTLQFPDRALARKRKAKTEPIDFTDLAVSQNYLSQIRNLGARLANPSRWLNAASFYAHPRQIDLIAALPFVKYVDLVRGFKVRPEPVEQSPIKLPEPQASLAEAHSLNYGPSLAQLSQLNVPAVHDLGYNGRGIILAMFDVGYLKIHPVFDSAFAEGRVLAEYDFIHHDTNTQDQPGQDSVGQDYHGTSTWSAAGGESPGNLYGPAFKAYFLLAKTEWVPAESISEEDNWAAAAEWVDSLGGDVISSSLGYFSFDNGFSYTYAQMNGHVAITSLAAAMAAHNGILVCNAMGNFGPGLGSLSAPADADSIISAGAVSSTGLIATFSSRGPTSDGRIKPELVARGVSTYLASAPSLSYGSGNGTSFSTPLLAGCAALLWSARPNLTNMQVRQAMIGSADRTNAPDTINYAYGYGLPDMLKALRYSFVPGDLNGDDKVTLADVVFLVNYIFRTGPVPVPLTAGDTNCDTMTTLSDIMVLVNFIFKNGPPACNHAAIQQANL